MARLRVGLDVGSTAVRAVELAMGSDPPSLVRAAQVPLPPGAVENGDVMEVAAVTESLRELWRRGSFKTREVTLGVGNQRVIVRELTVPAMPAKELRQSLPYQVQDLIPIPIDDAVLDFDVLDEFEEEGRKSLRLLVVAVQRESVDRLVTAAIDARLEPVGVDLVPFALVRSIGLVDGLGLDEGDAGGEAVVDIGADVTNVCVHERGLPRFVRILPSGGRDVVVAVSESLGIPVERVEALARGEQVSEASPDAVTILQNRVAALVDEIRSSLDFYQSQSPGTRVARALLTGGGSKLPGIIELLGARLGAEVRRGHVFGRVRVRLEMDEATLAEAESLLAVAVGLALPQEGG